MDQKKQLKATGCDRMKVVLGTVSDGQNIVVLNPTWKGKAICPPFGMKLDMARQFAIDLQKMLDQAAAKAQAKAQAKN